jgi:hypothetical protein
MACSDKDEDKRKCGCQTMIVEKKLNALIGNLGAYVYDNNPAYAPDSSTGREIRDIKETMESAEEVCGVSLVSAKHEVDIALELLNDGQNQPAHFHLVVAEQSLRDKFCEYPLKP